LDGSLFVRRVSNGWQINPKLTGEQLLDMIFASAYKTGGPADIIDPKAFIEMVSDTIK